MGTRCGCGRPQLCCWGACSIQDRAPCSIWVLLPTRQLNARKKKIGLPTKRKSQSTLQGMPQARVATYRKQLPKKIDLHFKRVGPSFVLRTPGGTPARSRAVVERVHGWLLRLTEIGRLACVLPNRQRAAGSLGRRGKVLNSLERGPHPRRTLRLVRTSHKHQMALNMGCHKEA